MNKRERAILNAAIGDSPLRLTMRTNTRIDVGSWWRPARLWVCITDQDVIVLAAARRRYLQRVPIETCQDSHYCHTTGELVIGADEELQFSRLAMPPTEGLRVLDAITTVGQSSQEQGTVLSDA